MEDSKEKLLKAIRHYQDSLERHAKTGNSDKLLHAIERLSKLPIRVCHLEETGIGRTVNGLKKVEGKVGENARNLVDKWKSMVKGEDDAEQERIENKVKGKPTEQLDENRDNEVMDEDPDPQSLQICDEDIHSDNEKPSYVETDFSSHNKSRSPNKNNDSNDGHKNTDRKGKSHDKHDKRPKRSHSSEQSDNSSSDSDSEGNHKPKKPKYDRDNPKKSKNTGHKSRRHSSNSESSSESESNDSESESSSSQKKSRKASRENSSASSNRSSSESEHSSTEDDASSGRENNSSRHKGHHSDRKSKRNHSSDSSESNSDTESRKRYSKSKETSSKYEEKETYKKHSKSNSDSDRDFKDKHSKSRDSHHESKDKHNKSKEKNHDSKSRHSKSKESMHEKIDKGKEHSSKKASSSTKSKTKPEASESKYKKDSNELEKSKSKSDSERDSKKSSKSEKYKESNGNLDSKKSSKSHKEKESNIKSPSDKKREHSTDAENKKHKGSGSDTKESKSRSHQSSSSSKSKDNSERKKDSENKKERERDKQDRGESEKSKKDNSTSSNSSNKGMKEKDKDKIKLPTAASSSLKAKMPPKHLPIQIDSESGASFADVLGMLEAPVFSKSKKKSSTAVSHDKSSPEKSYTSEKLEKASKNSPSTSAGGSSSSKNTAEVPKLLKDPGELEPLDINMTSLLPSITPNYRPLSLPLDDQPKKIWTDDEALTRVITAKHQRTKVYSGNKTVYTKVPTLFDLCSRVLQDNIDALEYTGGVPYSILKPIIEKATPDQLFQLEFHNPYLIEDSDELWLLHCQKEFRTKKREEMESWRDMYMRCLDEREAKLKALTANIKQSQDVKVPVRTTKLAYLDTVVKPPRNIARKQAKNGTAVDIKRPAQTPTERLNQLAKSGEASKIAVPNPGKAATERSSTSHSHSSHIKPKKAPLMAKTLSLLKNRFGRR